MVGYYSHKRAFTMIELGIVILLIAILAAITIPNLLSARNRSTTKSCIENLKRIESAKNQWGILNKKGGGAIPTQAELVGASADGFLGTFPTCPSGGTYTIGDMATLPTCSKSSLGHALPEQ